MSEQEKLRHLTQAQRLIGSIDWNRLNPAEQWAIQEAFFLLTRVLDEIQAEQRKAAVRLPERARERLRAKVREVFGTKAS